MTRFLRSAIRTVEGDVVTYRAAWDELRRCAEEIGVRAWRFGSVGQAARCIEFLEWKQMDRTEVPALDERLAALCSGLDQFGPAVTEVWVER